MDINGALQDGMLIAIREIKAQLDAPHPPERVGDARFSPDSLRGMALKAKNRIGLNDGVPYSEAQQKKLLETFGGLLNTVTNTHAFKVSSGLSKQNVSLVRDLVAICTFIQNGIPIYPCMINLLQTRELASPARIVAEEVDVTEMIQTEERRFWVWDGQDKRVKADGDYPFVVPLSYLWKRAVKSSPEAVMGGTVANPNHAEGHSAISTKDKPSNRPTKSEKPVLFAGTARFADGFLVYWDNDSGHYTPGSLSGVGIGAVTRELLTELRFPFPIERYRDHQ
ncbi:hypothetical protein HUA78_00535 [Myxococcus sp. CA033]|uniref:hypothetical protein n=1 Tax=Myxococcus sp. CA033 TaxID=2741516 RepID=UPI00157A7551|nr:hypothetical protein [Myxococcus sp. CA033]NTX32914.1 hypothetical protein [Myxococcus sp. CA033]